MNRPAVLIALILCASLYAAAASGSISKTEKEEQFWMLVDFPERDLFKTIGMTSETSKQEAILIMERALLKHPDTKMRITCAKVLGRVEAKSSTGHLARALRDADPEVRRFSALSLGFLKEERAFDTLLQLYKKEPSSQTRSGIVVALRTMEHKHSGGVIAKILVSDPNARVRRTAATALRELEEERAWKQLIQALDDTDALVRSESAKTLGILKEHRALDKLIELLQDTHAGVRHNVVGALAKLNDKKALNPLIAVLKDEDLKVRKGAASALGGIGSSKAIKPLEEMAKSDPDKTAREAATAAIKRLK